MKKDYGFNKLLVSLILCLMCFIIAPPLHAQRNRGKEKDNKRILTYHEIEQYKLSDEDLMSIQYYINCNLKLTSSNENVSNQKDLSNAQLSSSRLITNKIINIPINTPGVAVKVDKDYIYVDFGQDVIIPFSRCCMTKCVRYIVGSFGITTTLNINGIIYDMKIPYDEIARNQGDSYDGGFSANYCISLKVDMSVNQSTKVETQQVTVTGKTIIK